MGRCGLLEEDLMKVAAKKGSGARCRQLGAERALSVCTGGKAPELAGYEHSLAESGDLEPAIPAKAREKREESGDEK